MMMTNKHNSMDKLFYCLISECIQTENLSLSTYLKMELEKYSRKKRKQLVSRMINNCAPLFIACKNNNVCIVTDLIEICDANIEQKGEVNGNFITPLWYATRKSFFTMIQCLVSHGANINVQIHGYTLVHMKCLNLDTDPDKLKIISYLVQNGADISKTNITGQTCLMNSVYDVKLCSILLANGADVSATDNNNNTALHYAIKFNLETIQLLLEYNIDPHVKNSFNNDALQIACLKTNIVAFRYLTINVLYPPEELADAYELMGSIFYLKNASKKVPETLEFWQEAMSIRLTNLVNGMPLPKKPVLPKCEMYENATEFSTPKELDTIVQDSNAIITQCFLICERICGRSIQHNKIVPFMISVARLYLMREMYQNCINLLHRALQIEIENGKLLSMQTCFVIQDLVWIMTNKIVQIKFDLNQKLRFCDVVEIFKLISNEIIKTEVFLCNYSQFLLKNKRTNHSESNKFMILKYVMHILYLLIGMSSDEEENLIYEIVSPLVKYNPRVLSGQTLLHLCIYNNNIFSLIFSLFPKIVVKIINFLLKCGASVNDRDDFLQSPLHIACISQNKEIVQLLLDYGAHLDMINKKGETPLQMLYLIFPRHDICVAKYITLQCYAAQTICKYNICTEKLSPILCKFVDLHR